MADSSSQRGFCSAVSKLLSHRNSTSSPLQFRQALANTDVSPTDEKHLADIMVGIMPGEDDVQKWNLDVVVEVLSQDCNITGAKKIIWKKVVENLDNSNLNVRSMNDFHVLARLFLRISGVIFPASGLIPAWTNKTSQLYMLILAANCPNPDLVDFSDMVSIEQRIKGAPIPPTLSYLCLPLYDTLLELAGKNLYGQVLKTLMAASDMFPEYATILLARARDHGTNIRGEVLSKVLQKFTGLSTGRPTSFFVMQQLAKVNPDLLIWLLRFSLKQVATARECAELATRIGSLGDEIARRVEEELPPEELLGLWCMKYDKSDFNLESKLQSVLRRHGAFAKSLAIFARAHGPKIRPKRADGGVVSVESFSVIMKVLSAQNKISDSYVTFDDIRELGFFLQNHQRDQSAVTRMRPGQMLSGDDDHRGGKGIASAFDEVERLANRNFQKIYTSELSIEGGIQLLKQLKSSTEQRDQEVFRCMIHNLFDEYRFFQKYRDKELNTTAELFGMLIQNQLVSSITLGISLRYVLEALRRYPTQVPDSVGQARQGGADEKMFSFGRVALEQFRGRLGEWPQYCSHLLQIPHFAKQCPHLFQDAQNAMNNTILVDSQSGPKNAEQPAASSQANSSPPIVGLDMNKGGSFSTDPCISPFLDFSKPTDIPSSVVEQEVPVEVPPPPQSVIREGVPPIIDTMSKVNVDPAIDPITPSDGLRDQIFFIINNIAMNNWEIKGMELRELLAPEFYSWFASYLISKRISTQPNLHSLYLNVLDIQQSELLYKALLRSTYFHVTKLLQSPNITTSSSERSLLRNLGMWLGQITLARNRPIYQKNLNLKELLFWGYENGRLIAVCSFVSKIVEGVRDSKIFRPPNPWLMALLGVLRDLYETDDLKMNIKFEVQVLCKNVNIRIEDIPRSNLIAQCITPPKDGKNPDFTVKTAAPPPSEAPNISQQGQSTFGQSPQPQGQQKEQDAAGQHVIPNISSYVVINPSLQFFVNNPGHRRLVSLAVDKAIRDTIQPSVLRSARIACNTTKEVVLKDYANSNNENQMRTAARLMVSSLAGNLSAATSKEDIRSEIGKNLHGLLSSVLSDKPTLDQIVQVCSNDNVELGCALVEKAAMEKAIRDMDEELTAVHHARRKAREAGQPFMDSVMHDPIAARYLQAMPEALKTPTNGATAAQATIYEGFARQNYPGSTIQQPPQPGSARNTTSERPPEFEIGQNMHAGAIGNNSIMTTPQALETYQVVFQRIDSALLKVQAQTGGREVLLSMLGGDHEVLVLLRDMVVVAQRTHPVVRRDAAMIFAENIFKHLFDYQNMDTLRLDVMIGVIETLRDACGGPKKFTPDMNSWMSRHSQLRSNDEITRRVHRAILIRLMRSKVLRSQEADVYFALLMDGGRNMSWVEHALTFVRQCVTFGIAATHEFTNIFDTVSKMRPTNAAVRKQLQKWLIDLRTLATSKEEQKAAQSQQPLAQVGSETPHAAGGGMNPVLQGSGTGGIAQQQSMLPANSQPTPAPQAANSSGSNPLTEHVTVLLEHWLRVWSSANDQVFAQYLQLMHQYGVLKTEVAADQFFRVATELCIDACLKSAPQKGFTDGSSQRGKLNFTVIDALSKLFMLLVHLADKESGAVQLLSRILTAVARTLKDDHEAKKGLGPKVMFDQRPYYRLLANLTQNLGAPNPKKELNPKELAILNTYSHIYLMLVPPHVQGFAFAWLQLISHRSFMPHLLLVKGQKGWPYMHRLLISLLVFLQPFLKTGELNEAIRKLYKGMLRVLLVLLHDFPEFLSEYHVSFCDAIPSTCVQLRNLILSAFPRTMRLPDPFRNLNVDNLPEMNQPPKVLADYANALGNMKKRLDNYLMTKQPAEFPALIPQVLNTGGTYNVTLISVLTLYVGSKDVEFQGRVHQAATPAMEIFKVLVRVLDPEGCHHVLNAIANQLRYPNSHTRYFMRLILTLFVEADSEYLQEQITRVLLERLIVHRPHPWGLLVTFMELIKNPRFAFWQRSFTKCAPEIEKVFESVVRSCMGPNANSSDLMKNSSDQ